MQNDNFAAKEKYYDRLEFFTTVGGYGLASLKYLKNINSSRVKSLFSNEKNKILKNLLKKDGFKPKEYGGRSTAQEYILEVEGGNKFSVVFELWWRKTWRKNLQHSVLCQNNRA